MFNFPFPTAQLFPVYPSRPTVEDDEALTAFMEALQEFFQHLVQQQASTNRYFAAADFYFNDSHQESAVRTDSAEVTEQAIAAVIKNMTQPMKQDYVWSASENKWVLVLIPR